VSLLSNILPFCSAETTDAVGAEHPSHGWPPDPAQVAGFRRPLLTFVGGHKAEDDIGRETGASEPTPFTMARSALTLVSTVHLPVGPDHAPYEQGVVGRP
jgi:hypothetical protein